MKLTWKRLGVIIAAACLVGGVAVVASATGSNPASGTFRYSACLKSSTKTLVNVEINRNAVCSSGERAISWNASGPRGAAGPAGTSVGAGSSIVTSVSAPSGSCTTGNSDVDLTSGEVYSCASSGWSDAGYSLKGPRGAAGAPGAAGATGPAGPLEINALSLVDTDPQNLNEGQPFQLGTVTGQVGSSMVAGPFSVTLAASGSYLVTVGLSVAFSLPVTTFAVDQNDIPIPGFTGVIDSSDGSVTMTGIVTAVTGDALTVVETSSEPGQVSDVEVTVTQLS